MSCGLKEELKEESPLFTRVIQPCDGGAGWDTGATAYGAAVCTRTSQLAAEQLGCGFAPTM